MPKTMPIIPVIMCGGDGMRLWPLSRARQPKQFLPTDNGNSYFQNTVLRASRGNYESPVILCSAQHRDLVRQDLRKIASEPQAIFYEPEARNTAPAVMLAAHHLAKRYDDAYLLVLPSDHTIKNEALFFKAVEKARRHVNAYTTFGIAPTHPETGYGYIQHSKSKVSSFVEKPGKAQAKKFIASGDYLWNSGMFLLPLRALIKDMQQLQPDIVSSTAAALEKARQLDTQFSLDESEFSRCPSISIDYGLMEKTKFPVYVIPFDGGWSDVGSWQAMDEVGQKDANGNAITGDVVTENTRDCYLRSSGPLIATMGIDNLIVVAQDDVVLVIHKDKAGDITNIVKQLKTEKPQAA